MLQDYAGQAAKCCAWLTEQEEALDREPGSVLSESWRRNMQAFLPQIQLLLALTDLAIYDDQILSIQGQLSWPRETTDGIKKRLYALRSGLECISKLT